MCSDASNVRNSAIAILIPTQTPGVKLVELCGRKAGAGRCDCRGGGGCGVVLLAMVHGRVGKDTLLTGSNFWSELKIENHGIKTILLVRSCSLLTCRTGGFRFILSGRDNLTGTGAKQQLQNAP